MTAIHHIEKRGDSSSAIHYADGSTTVVTPEVIDGLKTTMNAQRKSAQIYRDKKPCSNWRQLAEDCDKRADHAQQQLEGLG